MRLIVIRKDNSAENTKDEGLLQFALSTKPVARIVFDGLGSDLCLNSGVFGTRRSLAAGRTLGEVVYALPQDWHIEAHTDLDIITFKENNKPINIEQFLRDGHRECPR
jgi:hypothetical protein